MPRQQELDLALGMALRDAGMDSVEMNNLPWVERMRRIAKSICSQNGWVSADDLRRYADRYEDHPDHHNAYGSIFRPREWVVIGRKNSSTPSAHAREIKIWRYRKVEKSND